MDHIESITASARIRHPRFFSATHTSIGENERVSSITLSRRQSNVKGVLRGYFDLSGGPRKVQPNLQLPYQSGRSSPQSLQTC